ncbi:hypothetical protein B5G50_18745 [Brevibacillus brevis]|nr:hypothetical protein B5G50_18745 [Brevibacillus brevis]
MKYSDRYKFVGLGTLYSETKDARTIVGFATPLPKQDGYVKHLMVSVGQNGKIEAVNASLGLNLPPIIRRICGKIKKRDRSK